jgi:hypothetical protein
MADFPVRTEELSASWLSGVLGAEVKGFSVEPLGAGAGMIGQSARLCIDYESGASGPATVIVKFPTQTEGNRVVADTFDMYGREVRFYQTIAGQTPARAPRPFHAEMAEENSDFVLLREDLSACRLGDQLAGADLADAHAAIDQMARLHATWWGRTDDPALSWIPIHDNPVQAGGMSQGFAAGWPVFLELFGDVLPGGRAEEYARIGPSTADCLRRMCGGVLTVVHGDFRLDNIFFDVPDDPTGVALFDWQGISKSCGPQDLGYFMSQSLRSEVRREHGSALVERYREKLLEAGVEGYSADQCWADYRASVLYLFTFAIVIAGTLDHSNERGRQMVHALASRAAETIAEIEALALLD